eukprot:449356-Rhodomonas_salina.2
MSSSWDDYEVIKQLAKGGQGTTSCVKKKSSGKQKHCKGFLITALFSTSMYFCTRAMATLSSGEEQIPASLLLPVITRQLRRTHRKNTDILLGGGSSTIMELCNRGDLANYLFDKRRRQSPLTEQVRQFYAVLHTPVLTSTPSHLAF